MRPLSVLTSTFDIHNYTEVMAENYKRYEMMSSRLLFTHGFLPQEHDAWSKRSGSSFATARMVGKCPVLRLERQSLGTQGIMQVVRKNYINLAETDEERLKATLQGFVV